MKKIVEATKAINALPSGSTRDLYSAYPSFSRIMNDVGNNEILSAIQQVIQYRSIKGNIIRRDKEEKFELLQEFNDSMLESINCLLDEMQGIKKVAPPVEVREVKASPTVNKYQLSSVTNSIPSSPSVTLITAKNILRPQSNFKIPVDNSRTNPFVPRIKDKPNSIRPLAILPEYDEDENIVSYLHPYELEIEKFEPSDELMIKVEPKVPENMDNFPFSYIDTVDKLKSMLNELLQVQEIAVDLEHHSYRTFQGITCLMQISTREKDFIIDTLSLRDDLHVLNEVFTRSNIVKVFHGADSDVEWLQRDLSLYIVNMFDTHQASKRLGLARLSLAYLLKHYCNIDADKTFQLADWRMRPLPQQLLKYAQQDTHYLLFIYDHMRNDLINHANGLPTLIKGVFHDSKIVCLKRYIKPIINENSYRDLYLKSKRSFDNQQLFALREIYDWRDKIAREEDESYPYVLPNHMLLQIAESLPREIQGILACCNPIPPLVRQNLNVIHQIILRAREQSVIKPIISDKDKVRPPVNTKRDLLHNPLYSPHDLSHHNEVRDDLPTLLGDVKIEDSFEMLKVAKVKLGIFNKSQNGQKGLDVKFVSPFDRYKLMIPFMEAQRKRELAQEEERKKQLLEEKKKQLPELEIVKIENDDVVEMSLKDIKRKRPHQEVAVVTPNPNKRWKKKREEVETPKTEINEKAIEEELRNVADMVDHMKKTNKQFKKGKQDVRQNSNKPVNFDYSNVDYSRFQGGSGGPSNSNSGGKFHQKYKGGGKSKGQNLDKMFNFSTFRLTKKK